MNIRVIAFATASDALGRDPVDIELADGARVSDLRAELTKKYPALEPQWPRLAVAVDGQLTQEDAALTDGVEVALLPPVSGGRPWP